MIAVFVKILGLALGETISPVILSVTLLLLGGKFSPIKRTLFFMFGDILAVTILGIIGLEIGEGILHINRGGSEYARLIDIAIGIILILLAVRSILKKPKEEIEADQEKYKDSDQKPKAGLLKLFLGGFILNMTNFSSIPFYLTACKEIGQSTLIQPDKWILVIFCGIFFILPVLLPLIIYAVIPKMAQRILDPLHRASIKYSKYIIALILLGFGIYLILK